MTWFFISLLIMGITGIIFGSLLLFKPGFVEKLRHDLWKEKNDTWPEKEGYFYDKYTRGLGLLIAGMLFAGFAIYSLI